MIATMRLDEPHPTAAPAVSNHALRALARVAGDGELMAHAVRRLEKSRAAIELEGWLLLQEMRLDGGIEIRHGLIGPGGIVVAVPSGPVPQFKHLEAVERQARALARLLSIERAHVAAAVVIVDSDDAPNAQFYDGISAIIVGDRQLPGWLAGMPTIIEPATLSGLHDAIFECAAQLAEASPPRLPDRPLWG